MAKHSRPGRAVPKAEVSEADLVSKALDSLAGYEPAEPPQQIGPAGPVEIILQRRQRAVSTELSGGTPGPTGPTGPSGPFTAPDQTKADVQVGTGTETTSGSQLSLTDVERTVDKNIHRVALKFVIWMVIAAAALLGWLILWVGSRVDNTETELRQAVSDHRTDEYRLLDQMNSKLDRLDDRLRNLETQRRR